MESFLIKSASGEGALEFFDRQPADTRLTIGEFWVRVSDADLSATGMVWAGYVAGHPGTLFREMADRWRGWPGELAWESLEGELVLRCSQDRAGHVLIRVELRSSPIVQRWTVEAVVMAEAGQLEETARRAELFFGSPV